jgi:hypothetical protein
MSQQKSISTLAFEHARRLAADPNICTVGYGAKLRAGAPVQTDTLVFYVREKLPDAADVAARGSWAVPPELDGFATDVVEVGHLATATANRSLPSGNRGTRIDDPLLGGVATMALGTAAPTPGPAGYGTLGGLAFDSQTSGTQTGAPLVLSNAHVWGQTQGVEVVQPIMASAVLGAVAATASAGTPATTVLTSIPPGLTAPLVFTSSIAQTYLVTGGTSDPLPGGQAATPPPAGTRTDVEQVTVGAPIVGLSPTGRRVSPTVSWDYRRLSATSVLESPTSAARAETRLLAARRLFTDAASYTTSQTINLYAEIIPASGGAPSSTSSHFALVLFYPLPAGDRFVPRLLRPAARQTPVSVTTQLQGFPAPARVGTAVLPVTVGAFAIDADSNGTFVTPPAGQLPAGTLALALPGGTVRVFVPPSTRVDLDIDLRPAAGPFQGSAVNSAGDVVASMTTAAGTSGRTTATAQASEIVELRLTGVSLAQLFKITSLRASPETAAPLSYVGSAKAADLAALAHGQWGASLFVQALDSGAPESANVVERANGLQALIADCLFAIP